MEKHSVNVRFCLFSSHTFCHRRFATFQIPNEKGLFLTAEGVMCLGMPLDREKCGYPPISAEREGTPMTLIIVILFFFNVYSRLGAHFPNQ
jgi:hypothetical protein